MNNPCHIWILKLQKKTNAHVVTRAFMEQNEQQNECKETDNHNVHK